MNLWQDPKSGDYFEIKDDGSKDLAIRYKDKRIEVRTPLLKRYMAARQLDAVLFIDTRVSVEYAGDVADFSDLEFEGQIGDELMYLSRSIGRLPISDARVDSLVFAKRILSGPGMRPIWRTTQSSSLAKTSTASQSSTHAIQIVLPTTSAKIQTHLITSRQCSSNRRCSSDTMTIPTYTQ